MPVRPYPVWISSTIMTAPARTVASLTALTSSGVSGFTPPSPCTTSTITAAVSSPTASSTAPAPFLGSMNSTSPYSGSPLRYLGFHVTLSDAMVRPWKEPCSATSFLRPVYCQAIFIAASTASVPVLRNTRPSAQPGASLENSSTASSMAGVSKLEPATISSAACLCMASTMSGFAWPRNAAPWPVFASRYLLPPSSHTYCMLPLTSLRPRGG